MHCKSTACREPCAWMVPRQATTSGRAVVVASIGGSYTREAEVGATPFTTV